MCSIWWETGKYVGDSSTGTPGWGGGDGGSGSGSRSGSGNGGSLGGNINPPGSDKKQNAAGRPWASKWAGVIFLVALSQLF